MMQSTTKFLSAAAIVVFGVTVLDHLNAQSGETQIASVSRATASPTDETVRAANPLRKLRLKQFSAISERPLFSPDRKPLPKSTKRKRRKPAGGNAKRKTPKRRARVDHLACLFIGSGLSMDLRRQGRTWNQTPCPSKEWNHERRRRTHSQRNGFSTSRPFYPAYATRRDPPASSLTITSARELVYFL